MRYITIQNKKITQYAQYKNSLRIEYLEKGKRKTQTQFFHDGNSVLIYDGFIPNVPLELTRNQINENMYHLRNAGSGVHEFMLDVFKYYKNNNILPVINTLQF